ncbi:hypothetical protein FQR65_LT00562 [Abscondita terminalis]|nr:hypothetical protein FQR65_LT00562 [Abscondita terminalis]
MSFKYAVLFCCLITHGITQNEDLVEYYESLIQKEQARALVYNRPQNAYSYIPNSSTILDFGSYDYIIVGAGSTGATIANRLSEIRNRTVLILEAGEHGNDFTDIPSLAMYLQGLEYNWAFNTTQQSHSCLGMINKQCPYPRGKGLGGSSLINAMMYVRGNKEDYDEWYKQGNPGWSFKEVLPLFKKSENFIPQLNNSFHGKGGLLDVEYAGPNSKFLDAFIDANNELGRKLVDYNAEKQIGVSPTQFTTSHGRRDSTAKAFLQPASNRTNLNISTNSLAIKIVIENATATGVIFSKNQQLYYAKAVREVISSAGSIGSPQLLMLSGLGKSTHLKEFGIPTIRKLKVGENFQDHPIYWGLQFSTNYTNPQLSLKKSIRQYLNGYGPLTIGGNSEGVAFMSINSRSSRPDIEHFIIPSQQISDITQRAFLYNDETLHALKNPNFENSFTITVILLRPKSRGRVTLKSASPFEYPLIEANYYTDKDNEDLHKMYKGIQFALELTETKAFKKINATLRHIHLPACKNYTYLSKGFWYCQLKQLTLQIYHPLGTCKMGKTSNDVVNHNLQVHGIKNLRVADASVVPVSISGHTNAVSIMIGEKLGELLT